MSSIIRQNTHLQGLLQCKDLVSIQGSLDGTIVCQNQIHVTQSGSIQGEVFTQDILIEGQVHGTSIEAAGTVRIASTSCIETMVVSPNLTVQPGAQIKGYFVITPNADEREQLKNQQNKHHATTLKPVRFSLSLPNAEKVLLIGDFCDWSEEKAIPMESSSQGIWSIQIQLLPGQYEYLLLVDGQPQPDPGNPQKVSNSYGGENSLLTVK